MPDLPPLPPPVFAPPEPPSWIDELPSVSFQHFLETFPPGRQALIQDLAKLEAIRIEQKTIHALNLPVLGLHCEQNICGDGIRLSEVQTADDNNLYFKSKQLNNVFLSYVCRNCRTPVKTYALKILGTTRTNVGFYSGVATKYGEDPPFGPKTPSRVITLLGPEKDYYLKGRRAENQGMGVGAYAYYRRVVENQKGRLLDEIIRVAEAVKAPAAMLDDLRRAKGEQQFSKAVNLIKNGISAGLLIDGHNPLLLLHRALSEGLHAQTDDECLALAESIRVVLADLADRIGHALKERAEIKSALAKLMK